MKEHARFHIADTAVAITEKARTQMKMAVSAEPWIPVGQIYKRVMSQLSSEYDVDTVNAVEANMARRGTAFLSKYQRQITGLVPTDRDRK